MCNYNYAYSVDCRLKNIEKYIDSFLKKFIPSVIKGNYSEIKALYDEEYFSPGVDAELSIDADNITTTAIKLAKKHKTVILATGKVDIVTDGKRTIYEVEYKGKRLTLFLVGVGSPVAVGDLEDLHAMGCNKFIIFRKRRHIIA